VVIILISVFRIADINPETPPEIKFSPTCFIISLSRFLILFIRYFTVLLSFQFSRDFVNEKFNYHKKISYEEMYKNDK